MSGTLKNTTAALREEITRRENAPSAPHPMRDYYMGVGYRAHRTEPIPLARAHALASLLGKGKKYVYENDIILGSLRGVFGEKPSNDENALFTKYTGIYGFRGWLQGTDHYASAYDRLLSLGIGGIIDEITASQEVHRNDRKKSEFLAACRVSMEAFSDFIAEYAEAARTPDAAETCRRIVREAPGSFREALQLTWFAHTVYLWEGKYAMALGRMDQYLYPFYARDIASGTLERADAVTMLENTFMKMHEQRVWLGRDDVCNICIAGVTPEGENAVNDLTYDILTAVGNCNIPGPNLSARINDKTPDEFVCAALRVIGTGLGYPALMSDTRNIAALRRKGYAEQDANNYCMVGCIENFLPGMQPPWSDGRFNTVKMLEYTLFRGRDIMKDGHLAGIDTGDPCEFASMDEFMRAYEAQLRAGAEDYACRIMVENSRYNNENYVDPFMSCLTYHCVERGLDICNGGARYPSAHGACGMGIGTIADSLAAIEKTVFVDKSIGMKTLIAAVEADFEGYEHERELLLAVPKYGNDCDETDKYAVWFVNYTADLFDTYRLADGGRFYTAIASNTSNISAGAECAASPSGRKRGQPLSDAASPTYGLDRRGPTYTVASITKPDYSRVACGTVVNQKFSPAAFRGEENIKRLCALIRVYFNRGGQEMQINSVSRAELIDAMEHPENYQNLVVRVSGFSAYYVTLSKAVQTDILNRTEQA